MVGLAGADGAVRDGSRSLDRDPRPQVKKSVSEIITPHVAHGGETGTSERAVRTEIYIEYTTPTNNAVHT